MSPVYRYEDILDEINDLPVIDTHDHILSEKDRNTDNLLYFFPHYINSDVVSAGMDLDLMEKLINSQKYTKPELNTFFEYWEKAKNTAYAKALLRGTKELFGFDDINAENYRDVEKVLGKSKKNGWYEKVFKKAKIEKVINLLVEESIKKQLEVDRKFFAPVVWFDFLLKIFKPSDIERIEKETDTSIHKLDDLIRAYDRIFEKCIIGEKAVAIKLDIAYTRTLRITKRSRFEAEKSLNRLFDRSVVNVLWQDEEGISQKDILPLQDYLIHHILQLAESVDIPVKIHTGIQTGYWNYVTNSDPTLLLELFNEYRKVRFDILHGGYPFINEMVSIAKIFQNVYIDTCWLHIISPTAAMLILDQLIEAVPSNKVFGFGGDYYIVEGAYGHLLFSKENIAKVLYKKIGDGYFKKNEAISYAKKILYSNAKEFFQV
jgi:predicted TIM-barrel fold metal-dependent hydrolase